MKQEFKKPGKYGRAFGYRITHDGDENRRHQFSAMSRLSTSDFPDILEDFLSISRKRQRNPTALSRLQLHMIEELLMQEGAVKHYKDAVKQLEGQVQAGNKIDEKELEFIKRELFFYRLYANAVRGIGDGIAWRALGYDRAVTRLLGERATKQNLASEGLLAEVREWTSHFEAGTGLAILNSLTNCLAMGDVTVVNNDGLVELVEVKSNKTKSSRKLRQKHAMKEVVTMLETGEGKNEERDIQIEILRVQPETYLDRVEELLATATDKGWAARKLSEWLYVEAFDFRKFDSADGIRELTDDVRKRALSEWEDRDDFIVDMNTLDLIAYSPNCAPFSIFPFRSRACIDLLIGAQFYVTFVNMTEVQREFEKRGWMIEEDSLTLLKTTGIKESILKVRKGPLQASVPPGDFGRLQIETLRPKTLIDALEAKLRQGPDGNQGYVLPIYEGEPRLWN